jgi:purine-binding chemotaxis protein CheW
MLGLVSSSIGSTISLGSGASHGAGSAGAGGVDPDVLAGVVRGAEGEDTVKIFNPQRLLRDEFAKSVSLARGARRSVAAVAGAQPRGSPHLSSFVSFALSEQETPCR